MSSDAWFVILVLGLAIIIGGLKYIDKQHQYQIELNNCINQDINYGQ